MQLYRWKIYYKPPIEEMTDNWETWRKVFFISRYECRDQLSFDVKFNQLKQLYKMKDEYIIIEDADKI